MSFLRNGELVDANGKVAGETQTPETTEVDTLREQLAEAQKERDAAQEQATAQNSQVVTAAQQAQAKAERDLKSAKDQVAAGQEQIKALKADVTSLKTENKDLAAKLKDAQARPALPEDAHARLVKVNGIADKLAEEALAALKAPAEAPKE